MEAGLPAFPGQTRQRKRFSRLRHRKLSVSVSVLSRQKKRFQIDGQRTKSWELTSNSPIQNAKVPITASRAGEQVLDAWISPLPIASSPYGAPLHDTTVTWESLPAHFSARIAPTGISGHGQHWLSPRRPILRTGRQRTSEFHRPALRLRPRRSLVLATSELLSDDFRPAFALSDLKRGYRQGVDNHLIIRE
jgi:hypothetical protein